MDQFYSDLVIAVIGAIIGAVLGAISTYKLTKKFDKKNRQYDIYINNLLPKVYEPLMSELRVIADAQHRGDYTKVINIKKINDILIENDTLILNSPENISKQLKILYAICHDTNHPSKYEANHSKVLKCLENLQKEIKIAYKEYKYGE